MHKLTVIHLRLHSRVCFHEISGSDSHDICLNQPEGDVVPKVCIVVKDTPESLTYTAMNMALCDLQIIPDTSNTKICPVEIETLCQAFAGDYSQAWSELIQDTGGNCVYTGMVCVCRLAK